MSDNSRLSSAEKKRLRDRRAQQNSRSKKLQYLGHLEERIARLEKQLAHCRQHHTDEGVQQQLEEMEGLRKQNESLLARQRQLRSLVQSWDLEAGTLSEAPSRPAYPPEAVNVESLRPSLPPPPPTTVSLSPVDPLEASRRTLPIPPLPPILPPLSPIAATINPANDSAASTKPLWERIPLNNNDPAAPQLPWQAYPEQIRASPDSPASPLDILYGSKTNVLADLIYRTMKRRPLRDPERLACGWLAYHLLKWVFSPSPSRFARLPTFMHPTPDQLNIPHFASIDLMIWPQIRSNLIRRWHIYEGQRDDLFGFLSCCLKVRWPWGESILERDEHDQLRIRRSFYETFMTVEGWGITPDVIRSYPSILTGVDLQSIVYEVL
ncbi:bZIP transcription factor [Aspergillus saccharolyticus JOP 1030-1]|uniref:BZIP domain-containing protein n=1 Tax=Aspergillus saccharolyticus JOP 1030-1 TaxID=1450539 RepID=A0A318Z8W6_9EURO|nr:hypothetical protein BP01DRAFT_424757 [Aspergillus saccharolyticus JOP 1030-1]PYH43706.1 hypothetical protein BP01DRAFT_424757 [Aspergillus saccharolyticus JOP 1030-1]